MDQYLVFGDQASDIVQSLEQLHQLARTSDLLQSYLRLAYNTLFTGRKRYALAWEVFKFEDSLLDLCKAGVGGECPNVAVNTVLSCINHLGWLLLEASRNSETLRPRGRKHLLAVCTGAIPAIACACSSSTADLLAIAPSTIILALEFGLAALQRAHAIETSNLSWTVLILNESLETIEASIDSFNKSKGLPRHRRAYISSCSPSSAVTISGPPSTLEALLKERQFTNTRKSWLSIASPFHADHLKLPAVDSSIFDGLGDCLASSNCNVIFGSGLEVSCKGLSAKKLIEEAIAEIFQRPQNWSAIGESLRASTSKENSDLRFIGRNGLMKSIKQYIEPSLAQCLAETPAKQLQEQSNAPVDRNAIAIIGMSGRFPGSEDADELWAHLMQGRDLSKEVPASRFDVKTHCDPTGATPNSTRTPFGCWYEGADLFDSLLFQMSPSQAAQIDPIQRILLLTAFEALEQAGYNPETANRKTFGSFFGQTSDDWREVNAGQNIDTYYIPGGMRAFGPGRLSYYMGWEGPSYVIDTACSSSGATLDLACTSLLAGDCDSAVAGGGAIMTNCDLFAGLSKAGVLSPTGNCKTFDQDADGYCRGDAVGALVLKRLSDAVRDRDNVIGVVKAVTTNHSAQASSITHPHAPTQAKLFRKTIRDAGLRPGQIDYVEMHGTGTQAGDAAEASSVLEVFGKTHIYGKQLFVGSVKANVGHGEGSSGVTSVIKALMMFQHSKIPPHVGIKGTMNPKLASLKDSNINIAFEPTAFEARPSEDGKRRILINNFNITSGNSSMVLENGFEPAKIGNDPRASHLVTISAFTNGSLLGNFRRLEAWLSSNPETKIEDLSYSLTARRMHHRLRQAYVVKDTTELLRGLRQDLKASKTYAPAKPGQAVFLFTGQASEYSGMGKTLFEQCSVFQQSILQSQAICDDFGFPAFVDFLTGDELDGKNPVQTQLALVAMEVALATMWKSWGIVPAIVLGHSLGEYAALHIAGVYSLADMLFMVGKRAQLMVDICVPHSFCMLAVDMPTAELEQQLGSGKFPQCELACHNGPESNVVSGPADRIKDLDEHLKQRGARSRLLQLPYAFHSAQMDPLLEGLETIVKSIPLRTPSVTVASALLGRTIKPGEVISSHLEGQYFVDHARKPVQFLEALKALEADGLANSQTIWVEVGPTPLCTSMVLKGSSPNPELLLSSLSPKKDAWSTLSASIAKAYKAGVQIKWHEYHRDFECALQLLRLPFYAFDLKSYWLQYQGDWNLRKHRALPAASQSVAPMHKSTTLQRIEQEVFGDDFASITFVSDLHDEDFKKALLGHVISVGNTVLCSVSNYADMGCAAGNYIWNKLRPEEDAPAWEIVDMTAHKPLVFDRDASSQMVSVTAKKDQKSSDITMGISSSDGVHYANWIVRAGSVDKWCSAWTKQAYLYKTRIETLESSKKGSVHHIRGEFVYKLFSKLMIYTDKYKGIEELYMDDELLEATAKVSLKTGGSAGTFACSPYAIESLAHLGGFLMNVGKSSDDTLFISGGWGNLRAARPLTPELNPYQCYVRMQPTDDRGAYSGDVMIFSGDEIVAVVEGQRFQAIKKSVLGYVLGVTTSTHAQESSRPTGSAKPQKEAKETTAVIKPAAIVSSSQNVDVATEVVLYIASELGVGMEDLGDTICLGDMGVDSLMIIDLQAKMQSRFSLVVPASYLANPSTVGDLRQFISPGSKAANTEQAVPLQSSEATPAQVSQSSSDQGNTDEDKGFLDTPPTEPSPPLSPRLDTNEGVAKIPEKAALPSTCSTTALQYPSIVSKDSPTLVLFPDGAGSPAIYTGLGKLHPSLRVLGLSSPFLIKPHEYTHSLETVASIYVRTVLNLAPNGPLILGGASIGGVLAHEAARQLIKQGREVTGLVLLDSPCPQTFAAIRPETLLKVLSSTGSKPLPANVYEHFRRSAIAMEEYTPSALSIKAEALWATGGMEMAEEQILAIEEEVEEKKAVAWMLRRRTDVGPQGWENLVDRVNCEGVEADHFTFLKNPKVKKVSEWLQGAVERLLSE